jgi:twinkle protein
LLHGEPLALAKRSLDRESCEKYRYHVGVHRGEPVQIANYCDAAGRVVAQKIRFAEKRRMEWAGESKKALPLFGQHLWGQGGKRVVVTEGEIDAVSLAQAMQLRWPVVSIPNGAQGAKRDLVRALDFLSKYTEVVLMFDMDEPGRKAAVECAELLAPGVAKIAQLPLKDANDMLVARREGDLVRAVWEAQPYRPDGLVCGEDLWATVSTAPEHGLSYPWPCLNEMTFGMRRREIVTWTAGTGIGKSSFVREVAHHIAITHGQKVGIIALEESVRTAALAQMSLAAGKQMHLPPVWDSTTEEERRAAFDATLGKGLFVLYDHFGTIDAGSVLPKIRFMALAESCRWIILDHVSIMVSGTATEGDERKRIDELMTKLRSLAEELNLGIHIVSHLRKANGKPHEEGGRVSLVDLRGSGAIAQISNITIGVERDQQSNDAAHVSTLRVLKNRFSGTTGIAGTLEWDQVTGRLAEVAAGRAVGFGAVEGEDF